MDYTSIKVGQLPSAAIAGTNLIPHEVEGLLKKATITDLAAFISANGAVGFRAVSVPNGGTLPSTTQQEFILVGPGTYNNVGGGSPITVTEELNALVSNGTFWFIGVQIPIEAAAGGTANWGGITGTLSAQTDLQTALNAKQPSSADLSSIAGLTGTSGLLRKTAANTYSLDTNTYVLASALSAYLPLTGGTLESSGSSNTLNINHSSGSGIALSISKNGNGEGLTIVKGSGSGNAASITGGVTLLSELNLTTKLADAHINSAATWNAKQNALNGTGFVKISGTTISYDNNTYALDSAVVKLTGNQTITGIKSFNSGLQSIGSSSIGFTAITGGAKIEYLPATIKLTDIQYGGSLTLDLRPIGLNTGVDRYISFPNKNGIVAMTSDIPTNLITGTGTTNYLPKFTGASVLGNSQIFDNGTNVGVGTTSPVSLLNLYSDSNLIQLQNSTTGSGTGDGTRINLSGNDLQIINRESANTIFFTADTERIRITSGGNVGIGTTSPSQKLDVNGLINSTNGISVGGSGVSVVWTGTQAAYDAIATKSSTTIYFIQ